MENEKNMEVGETLAEEGDSGLASRARNRTVMLTPEITGEVRARLAQDLSADESHGEVMSHDPVSSYAPAEDASAPAETYETAPLQPAPLAPPAPRPVSAGQEGIVWSKLSPVVGFLVSYDKDPNGSVFELRSGRLIVSNASAGEGNFLLIDDESVSPMHAIIRISSDGTIQVLDQLSEYGTKILRVGEEEEEELSGEKSLLGHGDLVMFGERTFHVCVVVPREGDE